MCEDKIVILSILQSYALHWYHTYILHPGMDRMEETIFQNIYWTDIRNADHKELSNCDTCQRTKSSNIKNSKLSAKEGGEIPWKKI